MLKNNTFTEIEKLDIGEATCKRVSSYKIVKDGDDISCAIWQCSMGEYNSIKIKLPTAINLKLSSEYVVKECELLSNFKGSQGIPCSWKYLNRKLKEKLVDVSLNDPRIFKNDKLDCECQHINDVIYGLSALLLMNAANECNVYNATYVNEIDNGLLLCDDISYNGKNVHSEIRFIFDKGAFLLGKDGKLKKMPEIKVRADISANGKKERIETDLCCIETQKSIVIHFIKGIFPIWKRIGLLLGAEKNFYFSNMYPKSFFGLFIQCLALIIYPDNYSYVQYLMKGLQRIDGKPLCIGMIEDIEEGEKYFPSFSVDDLY